MPRFPVFEKEWEDPVTLSLVTKGSVALQQAALAVAINTSLIGLARNPWILKGCSDGVSANTSGINLWIDETDIVPATSGNHSWAWWRHPSGLELVIDFNRANNLAFDYVWSPSGAFTGGSVTARPTATDEQAHTSLTAWASSNVGRFRMNIHRTTDGRTTYLFVLYRGTVVSLWIVGDAHPGHSAWSPSTVVAIQGSNSLTAGNGLDNASWFTDFDLMHASMASGQALLRWTSPYLQSQQLEAYQSARPSRSGRWQFWSIGLMCDDSPRLGKHGRMIDMWKIPRDTPKGWVFRSDDGKEAVISYGGYAVNWSPDMTTSVY